MRTFNFKRWTAAVITVLMLIGVIPFSTFAASAEFTNSQLSVAIDKESTLAPGVTLNDYTVYDKNGDQVRMFVTKADMSVDTVKLFASYKNMDPTVYGMSKLTEQVAAFNNKAAAGDPYYQGTVVAGINSSYYNMTTGKPTGTFVMNGIDVTNEAEGNSRSFFAVLNDGSVMIGGKGEYSSYKGQIKEAIGGYFHIVKDGQVYEDGYWSKTNPQKYPRQTIGITAEGDVILMMADGNQAPKSIGLTLLEQAQVMVDLGCVEALHLDGGGSGTYACKPEGQDDFVITNSPSDGSERSISNGFIIVSTAVASYTFDHVAYEVENDYMTPGTSVNVAVSGVSSTGNAADVPADITYVVDNGTYADGVFTAGDAVGDATITAMYNGQAVGSVTLNVVLPDAIAFSSAEMTVPYGKTVALGIDATYGVKEVAIKASDFTFALSNSAVGTIDGFNFTACAEDPAVTESDISAVLNGTELTANAKIILGKGSEVVYDFEDGTSVVVFDETPGTKYNYVWPETTQEIVDATTGEVHSGNYALSGVVDYSNSLESGYMKTSMYSTEQRVFKNAKKVGIWIYIDDEFDGLWARWTLQSVTFDANGNPVFGSSINSNNMDNTVGGTGVVSSFTEPGWHYLWADVSAYEAVGWKANSAMMQFYLSDRDGSAFNYVSRENRNIPATYQFYFDDITVDYSSAVDDREAPIFGGVTYAVEGMPDAAALNNQTVNTGKVTFAAKLADNTTLTNATGINADSVKAYIDGIETKCTYTGGVVTADVTGLDNGKHQVKFAAEDKMGNYASAFGYITVAADDSGSTVKLVPHDADLTYPKLGSIYWMDLVATDIQTVKSVEATIDLDNNSTWQLDHMTVATGFEASYTVDERFNVATVTVTKTGDVDATGEAALVSMPVRVWTLKEGYVYPNGTKAGAQAYTLRQFTTSLNEYWGMAVIADIDRGVLVRVDDTIDSFSGDGVKCDTEMWFCGTHKGNVAGAADYYNSWDKGHYHTAEAVADVAATCTTAGYTGRTFCAACNSVVDWGTTIAAAGHDYAVTDGVLKCECGEVFNGVYTDGKTYVDGVMLSGWVDGKYYADGVALTGIAAVDGVYYNFGDDGVSKGKYTGLVEIDGKYYYAKLGTLTAGWFDIDGAWYYFLPETLEAAEGSVTADNGITFDFVDGKVQSVVWEDWYSFKRCWYGPSYYYNTSKNVKYLMVEIDGDIYFFNSAGCMQKGVVVSHESNRFEYFAYDCGTDGKGQLYTGVAEDMYFENGWQVRELRLAYANGEYVFVKNTNKVADTCTVDLVGELTGLVFADGEVYYVENGYPVAKGLVQASDGNYYLITSTLKAVKNCWYGMNETHLNGYSLATGIYWFYEDGRMQVKEGIYREKNGNICYYENGYPVAKGLVQDTDGSYYLFTSSKKAVVNSWYGMNETHLNGYPLATGIYWFGEDGRMQVKDGIYVEKSGAIRYYENGYPVAKGLVRDENCNYYYIDSTKNAVKSGTYTITEAKTNGLLPAGKYEFGSDAKMINAPHIPADAVKENVVDPTCTTTGSYDSVVYCSVCGIELSREAVTVDALGHSYDAVVTAPTCTEAGYTTYTCSACGDSYVADDVAALGHTEGEAVVENNTDPVCTEGGSYESVVYCSVCGIELSRETVTVEALGHSYDAVVTAPTCTEAGYTTYTCSLCGDSYVADEVAALGHSWDDGVTVAPTCTETGLTTYTCTACGDTRTETIAALGHSYDAVVTAPTCTEAGYTTYTCSVCGDTYVADEVAALGHGEATEVIENNVEPTCTEGGSYEVAVYCMVCNEEFSRETVTVNKLGHDLGDWTEKTAATCTTFGEMIRECSRCDYSLSKVIAPLGHTEGEAVEENKVEPTCTENGSYDSVVYCSVCGAQLSREEVTVDMLGHAFGDWAVTVEPTYTAEGEEARTCATCGETETRVVDKLVCAEHVWSDWTVTVEPTVDAAGEEQRSCSVCGATETQEIPALDNPAPTVAGVNNYTVTLNDIIDIKEIRFAIGTYTTGTEVKAAEKNVTLNAAIVESYTVDGVFTYDLPWMGSYTFWVRTNSGLEYFLYVDVNDINTYVTSNGVKITVNDFGGDYKDMWIAEGHWESYYEIKNYCFGFKYQAATPKLNELAKTSHDFSYVLTNPGEYTVLIRYNDGTFDVIYHTIEVEIPEFTVDGYKVTVSNIEDVKIIRTASGHYTTVGAIKSAAGTRYMKSDIIGGAEEYSIYYPADAGEITILVEYLNGYKHFEHITLGE